MGVWNKFFGFGDHRKDEAVSWRVCVDKTHLTDSKTEENLVEEEAGKEFKRLVEDKVTDLKIKLIPKIEKIFADEVEAWDLADGFTFDVPIRVGDDGLRYVEICDTWFQARSITGISMGYHTTRTSRYSSDLVNEWRDHNMYSDTWTRTRASPDRYIELEIKTITGHTVTLHAHPALVVKIHDAIWNAVIGD